MKEVTVHWVEMRVYEFPDDAPVNDINELGAYVDGHPEAKGDWEYFCIKYNTRDWEIVT